MVTILTPRVLRVAAYLYLFLSYSIIVGLFNFVIFRPWKLSLLIYLVTWLLFAVLYIVFNHSLLTNLIPKKILWIVEVLLIATVFSFDFSEAKLYTEKQDQLLQRMKEEEELKIWEEKHGRPQQNDTVISELTHAARLEAGESTHISH